MSCTGTPPRSSIHKVPVCSLSMSPAQPDPTCYIEIDFLSSLPAPDFSLFLCMFFCTRSTSVSRPQLPSFCHFHFIVRCISFSFSQEYAILQQLALYHADFFSNVLHPLLYTPPFHVHHHAIVCTVRRECTRGRSGVQCLIVVVVVVVIVR